MKVFMDSKNTVSQEINKAADNYWDYVPQMIATALHAKNDINVYLKQYRGLVDFGIAPQQLSNIKGEFPVISSDINGVAIEFISDWIKTSIEGITRKTERDTLLKSKFRVGDEIDDVDAHIRKIQGERRALIKHLIDFSEETAKAHRSVVTALPLVDKIRYDTILKNDAVSRGRYLTVDERRAFVTERKWLAQQDRRIEAMLSLIDDRDERTSLDNLFSSVQQLINEKVILDSKVNRMGGELISLDKEISLIPVSKIVGRIAEKVIRLKTLVSSEVERGGGETGLFRAANEDVLNIMELYEAFRRIAEFDRDMFLNTQAVRFGRPTILLVPGKGDGIYDYRDNLFIIPMIPNFNIGESISSAVIGYRLHNDLEKKLLRSYGGLRVNHDISAGYLMKCKLAKSYSKWTTVEYEGFRVLDKSERKWFNSHCAPQVGDFYYPMELTKGGMAGDKYAFFVKNIRMELAMEGATAETYWYASIINCQQGRYEKAVGQLKRVLDMTSSYIYASLNLGLLYLKLENEDLAKGALAHFVELNPQSWWARVAQEYIKEIEFSEKK
jgi:tetratricopeptide (TPR) repeat protein